MVSSAQFSKLIHVAACISSWFPFFFVEYSSIAWICYILFIHSSGVVSSRSSLVWIKLPCACFWGNTSLLLGTHLEVEVLGHYVTLCLTPQGPAKQLFKLATHCFTFPLAMSEGSNWSTSLPILVIIHLLDGSHLPGYEGGPHFSSVCIALIFNDGEHLFMWLLATDRSSLEKCRFKSFAL